ncbi:heavy metal translocating P-type ATPase [Flavobacterium sp. NKUCC04_CG]|uniref:heavy metal translocating P-type ATPase n=1 Tax=Flavobacterium sp. NKUCC04_CG TaxID=2842121 RepID=UPI001C5AEB25|nr:heavy metal translocating P-type ATPase [Flavobacterium sp. NKUCC04_CG]MBW3520401.1 cadmium-translocating P-type ATPase [Flavobacterium sp. NKUCC04_CG]
MATHTQHKNDHDHDHDHNHDELDFGNTEHTNETPWKTYLPAIISFLFLASGIAMEQLEVAIFHNPLRLIWYIVAYLYVGLPVNIQAFKQIKSGNVFSEFFLMSIATFGAFAIGEYSEGVAVMLFYSVGELFQHASVDKAKRSIKALLDVRPDVVTVLRNNSTAVVSAKSVAIGEIIQIKPGEKVGLDGILLSTTASFNTAALTGESKPDTKKAQETVLAGMINLQTVCEIQVSAKFEDSKLSKILILIQDATARKSKTQQFISKFAKVYTPIVVVLAILIAFAPALWTNPYVFSDWLYRALVFLVISCPCALVISVPLGYFGGIGLASKNGILFKGSNYLDVMTQIDTVVMDKTGTLTKGVFEVQKVNATQTTQEELLAYAVALERHSTHPIASAIVTYADKNSMFEAAEIEEIPGHGLKGLVNGKIVLAGNSKLLDKYNVAYPTEIHQIVESIVILSIDQVYAGYITVADEIKEDAFDAIAELHKMGIKTMMLSGDKDSIVQQVAKQLGIDNAYGNLLPEDKVRHVEDLKMQGHTLAFTGDGINDAPVLALADAGIAMGGLGSDAAIETADIVIQNDQPSKIPTAIKIGKKTRQIVYQNIVLAFAVKIIVLTLGATGNATLWEAVFADVGVALLAILNAVRIQNSKL